MWACLVLNMSRAHLAHVTTGPSYIVQGDEQAQCALRAQRSIRQAAAAPMGPTQAQGPNKRAMAGGPRPPLTPQVGRKQAGKLEGMTVKARHNVTEPRKP